MIIRTPLSFYHRIRALLSGKQVYHITGLNRIVYAKGYTQCYKRFSCQHVEILGLFRSLLITFTNRYQYRL